MFRSAAKPSGYAIDSSADGCYKPPVNWNRFQSVAIRRQLEGAPEADMCPRRSPLPASWTPGDAFAETNKTTGIAPLMSTVHAAVGTVIEHRRMVGLPHTLEASKPHGVEHGGC